MTIKLGSRVKDSITGFEGIAVARTEWLYGCSRITIESTKLDIANGEPIPLHSFDEQRVVLIEEKEPQVSPASSAKTGGSYPDPERGR